MSTEVSKQPRRPEQRLPLDAIPPHDMAMERGVIGAMILEPTAIEYASIRLKGSDFYDSLFGDVFDALSVLHEMGQPTMDVKLLLSSFKRYGLVDEGFGSAEIAKCVNDSIVANLEFYVGEVARFSRHRQLMLAMTRAYSKLTAPQPDLDAIAESVVKSVSGIQAGDTIEIVTLKEAAKKCVQRIQASIAKGIASGLPSGIQCLDETIGGFCEGEVTILAARPGHGKTALAMQIAAHIASEGTGVLFVSLEMKDYELAERKLCAISNISSKSIRNGSVTQANVDYMSQFIDSLNYPVSIYSPKTATIGHIAAAVKLAVTRGQIGAVMIDYVQRIQSTDSRKPRHEQLEEISAAVKERIARAFNVPVILLCQLNRDGGGKPPRTEDLKGSGSLEQDADVIIAIHTPVARDRKELHVLKNRHGDEGLLTVRWIPHETKFEDLGP